jgi:hypothetical protein
LGSGYRLYNILIGIGKRSQDIEILASAAMCMIRLGGIAHASRVQNLEFCDSESKVLV